MLDFQRKKDSNILSSGTPRDNSFFYFDQSKNLYDFILKHDNQMKKMESEIINLKTQILELTSKIPFLSQNNNFLEIEKNNNLMLNLKEEIKGDLIKDLNDVIISQKNEFKEQIDSLREEIEIIDDNKNNNNKILEINNSLQNLNQQLMLNNEEKNNLENIILNKVENDKKEINLVTSNINKRIDNFDLDFDRLIQSLKVQFLNSANSINQLEMSKVNISDYERQIDIITQSIEELNNKIDNNNQSNINENNHQSINRNLFTTNNEENDINSINNINNELDKKLNSFKDELYNDIEKINLKILSELKNQADDIKILYQELNNANINIKQINKTKNKTSKRDLNLDLDYSFNPKKVQDIRHSYKDSSNTMSIMEIELSKKANLDQLNLALETQAKLNEAFSSATRISRFCWDSEGILSENKYIKWSIQNINTALDAFKWENNSDTITILQNGVYKIVVGLIGLETKKSFGLVFNNDENIIADNNDFIRNENDINSDKGNIKFMEKYIACEENTKIKVFLFDNNDNSEEAFLELTKII